MPFIASITVLRAIIYVSNTYRFEVGCHANPAHMGMLYISLVYACYCFVSLQLFNLIQSLFHLHATKMDAAKSEQSFVQAFSGNKCRQVLMRARFLSQKAIKNINTSVWNWSLKLKSLNQIKHTCSCPLDWKWPSFLPLEGELALRAIYLPPTPGNQKSRDTFRKVLKD